METKELVEQVNKQAASENLEWARECPDEACRVIWWLLGYSGIGKVLKEVMPMKPEPRPWFPM